MTTPLVKALQSGPALRWVTAVVASVQTTEKAVTVTFFGVNVPHVGYLASYTPTVGDKVHCLLQDNIGMIVLGKQDAGTPLTTPESGTLATLAASSVGTFSTGISAWTEDSIAIQTAGQVRQGAWFYASFAALPASSLISKFEIQVLVEPDSGPLSFRLHSSANTSGPLTLVSTDPHLAVVSPGILSWVALPLDWLTRLKDGSAKGVAVASDTYNAVVGGGTLRTTLL